jgi:hypothetical protein
VARRLNLLKWFVDQALRERDLERVSALSQASEKRLSGDGDRYVRIHDA